MTIIRRWLPAVLLLALLAFPVAAAERRLLYVAVPGIRNYLEYGGHGLLVFDIDAGHRFVRRIPLRGLDEQGRPVNVKGVCASAATGRVWVSTIRTLQSVDLRTGEVLWERAYDGGCDRMSISPDGRVIYLPSFEKDHWHAIDSQSGNVLARLEPKSGAHNTVYGASGRACYLAGLRSPLLTVADTQTHQIARTCGPFSASIRPFTVNGRETLCFVNVNDLLGFEVGDLTTGKKLYRVEVPGFVPGPVKRHGCPSHGIGLTPDERQVWVVDAFHRRLHVFDATVMPPAYVDSVAVRDEPGWITFSIRGDFAYPSTGDVIDPTTRKTVAQLTDETGAAVHSEKMVEIHFDGPVPVRTGDQFGVGRVFDATAK